VPRYEFRTTPYTHQRDGMMRALKILRRDKVAGGGVALLMEPRTGKSKTTIDTLGALHVVDGVRKVLVVCPSRVMGVWLHELHTHCPLVVHVTIWDAKARKQDIPEVPGVDLHVVVTNFEAFSTPGKRLESGHRSTANGRMKTRARVLKWARAGGLPSAAVIDESHKIKNPAGKASVLLVSMAPAFKYRFALTGTPVTKASRVHDLFMQWQWVNPDRFQYFAPTIDAFKQQTGRWTVRGGIVQWVAPRQSGIDEVQRLMGADAVIVRRADCFDLPAKETRIIPVRLGSSRVHYVEMARDMITQIREGVIAEAAIPLVVTLRLMQLTGGFVGTKEIDEENETTYVETHRVGSEKLDALEELLREETLEAESKVVIAARFRRDLDDIAALCKRIGLSFWELRGGIPRSQTDENVYAFRKHTSGPAAMLIQPSAAALGVDLSTANHMVWYSLTHSWVDYSQGCDRIALHPSMTTFTYLLAEDSVDQVVYDVLQSDGDVAHAVLKHPERLLGKSERV